MDRRELQTKLYLLQQKIQDADSLLWQLKMKRDEYQEEYDLLKTQLNNMDGPVNSTPYVTAKMVSDILYKETGDFTS